MKAEDAQFDDPALLACLAALAGGDEASSPLPWVERLSPRERVYLRSDLAEVLAEPEITGEPVDWREIIEILREWAEVATWDGVLIHRPPSSTAGPFAIKIGDRDNEALAGASPAVQKAMQHLLADFLPYYPTSGQMLPRGRLKKLRERDVWQLHLPDGYRLRYVVDKVARLVSVVYLGPHPDHDPRDREQTLRSEAKRRRYRHG